MAPTYQLAAPRYWNARRRFGVRAALPSAAMQRLSFVTAVLVALASSSSCDEKKGEDAPAESKSEEKSAAPEAKADAKTDAKVDEKAAAPATALVCPDGGAAKGAAPPAGHEEWCEKDVGGKPLRHGRWTRWYDGTDKRWHEQEYREGKLHGPSTSWHENGQKSEEGEYQDDLKNGHFTAWGEDGAKRSEGDWKAGKRSGPSVDFWPNGKPRVETQ